MNEELLFWGLLVFSLLNGVYFTFLFNSYLPLLFLVPLILFFICSICSSSQCWVTHKSNKMTETKGLKGRNSLLLT